jgi:hypothetical protein
MINLSDIRKLKPYYDLNRYLPEGWQGSVSDILRLEACPEEDRIWLAVRLVDEKTARLFAVWCAREALALVSNPDPRSIAACDVTERYAHGQATSEELHVACFAAWLAWEEADVVARVAWEEADVSRAEADAAAWAARAVVDAARGTNAEANAARAAWYVSDVTEVARKKQVAKLLEMVEGRNEK